MRVLPAGHAWYERILHDMFWEFPLNIIGAVLTLALCAGILYTLGWVAQAVAQVALWLIAKPLQALAALLAHRRLYKALLAVTLLSTVLTALLPNEIKC